MDLLKKIKQDLDIETEDYDVILNKYLFEITEKIKSMCNRIDFPSELNYLAIKYVEDCYYYYKNIENNGKTEISSVSDNGQTINFKTSELIKKENVDLNKILELNKAEISQYAFARW